MVLALQKLGNNVITSTKLGLGCLSILPQVVPRPIAQSVNTAAAAARSIAAMAGREVAVVGGGVSGLYCASVLSKHGHKVTVFDLGKHAPGKYQWQLGSGLLSIHPCTLQR